MKNISTLDYNNYYDEIFADDKKRENQKKVNFLNFLSETILSYSFKEVENKISSKEEEPCQ